MGCAASSHVPADAATPEAATIKAPVAGKLTYFAGLKSRGEPPQLIAGFSGVNLEVELIDFAEWGKRKSATLPSLPYITKPDGTILLETIDICKYIAELGGKFVVDSKQAELQKKANSAPIASADPQSNMPDGGISLGVPPYDEWLPTAIGVLKEYVAMLGDGPFFAGAAPGYGEAHVWHNLDMMFFLAKADIATAVGEADMAKLQAFYDKFAALGGIKEYIGARPKVWGVPGSKGNKAPVAGKLTYFAGIKSRGEPPQLVAGFSGVNLEVELIDFAEWGKRKSATIPSLPYITKPDGTILLETIDICKYIAELGGKFVVDSKQAELQKKANSAPIASADPQSNMPDGGISLGVPPYDEWLPTAIGVLKEYVAMLGDGPFFAGAAPGYGEAHVWHNLDMVFFLAKADIATAVGEADMAKLQAFYDKFAALGGIKEYIGARPKVWGVPGSKGNPAS